MNCIKPFSDQGHYTGVHNIIFDYVMPRVSHTAFKVLCFIIRKTKGHGKKCDEIPYTAFFEGTGISSPTTINKAIKELEDEKIILKKSRDVRFGSVKYALNRSYEIPLSAVEESPENSPAERVINESGITENVAMEPATENVIPENGVGEWDSRKCSDTATENGASIKTKKDISPFTNVQGERADEISDSQKVEKKSPKKDAIPNDHPVRLALVAACQIDTDSPLTSRGTFIQVAEATKAIIAAGTPPDKIEAAAADWYVHDWRGQRGDPPTPAQFRAHLSKFLTQGNSTNGIHQRQPEQSNLRPARRTLADVDPERIIAERAARRRMLESPETVGN